MRVPTVSVPPAAATFDGYDGLSDTNYYTATPGIAGAANQLFVQTWIWIESQAVASANRVFLANAPTSAGGWRFLTSGTNTALNFAMVADSLTKTSASLTLTAGHIGRPLHVAGGVGPTGGIVLWVDGVRIGSPTAFTTYAAPVVPSMSVGRRLQDTLNAQGDIRVIGGVSGGSYNASDADVAAAYTAGRAAGDISHVVGATDPKCWSFKNQGLAASIIATVGTEPLVLVGTPVSVTGIAIP